MKIIGFLLAVLCLQGWIVPTVTLGGDDFDFDALFDFDELPEAEATPVVEETVEEPPAADVLFDENDFFDDPVPPPVNNNQPAEVFDDELMFFDEAPSADVEADFVDPFEDFDFDEAPAQEVVEPQPAVMRAEEPAPAQRPVEVERTERAPERVLEEAPVEVAPVEPVFDPNNPAHVLARQEEVRRQADETEGRNKLQEGFTALEANRYRAARDAFEVALTKIPDRAATQEERRRARWGLAEAHYRIARDIYRDEGDLRTAKQSLVRTEELSPNHRGVALLQRRIAREEARRLAEEGRPVPVEQRMDVVERRQNVEDLMREGRAYYHAGELDNAETLFENVLLRDQYNTDAMRYLRRIYEDRMKVSEYARLATQRQMMLSVRDAWTPPRRGDVGLPEDLLGPGPQDMVTPSRRLQERMEAIVIPRIEFRQANIRDVVSFLRDASEAADPDGDGVNIILNLDTPDSPSAPAPAAAAADAWGDDPWGDAPASAPAFDAGMSGMPSITLNLRRITLMEALRYITEVAGLRYRIEDNAVVITPAGVADVGRVLTRLYPVQPSFLDLVADQDDAPQQTGFGEFGSRRPPSAGRSGGDVKGFFEGAGVPFPVGTSITYNPTISQLIVANTPENLERFERILSQLNVVPSQVEIEARFVEVAEEDLKELGLQWMFTDNYQFMQRRGDGPLAGRESVQIDRGSVSRGQRSFASTDSGIDPVSQAMLPDAAFLGNILSISSILTNPEMRVVVHALSQNGNTDVLSAPRVTTRSGVNASIEVVTEIIYPTDFRVTEPTITGASGTTGSAVISPPTVTPENFETRRTGVILNVTPTVGPDGYTIDLSLAPEVAELVDWIQYGSRLRVPNPADPNDFQEFVYNIPQPVFASRNVTTSIVIWDGQTVVMGGLMRERLVTYKDKIPILGDIPFLGRLFRTEGTRSRKENLLIFVTARLVDPAGKPIHRADAMSVPAAD